jgi:hypothetical protein
MRQDRSDVTARAHTFHGAPARVFEPDDVLLDADPLIAACVADEQTADDWESGEADFLDVDDWLSITFQRWHRYQRACQDAQRLLCWQLLIEHTNPGRN